MRHLADLLHDAPDVTLTALLGPEHGARGEAQDMEDVEHALDRRTGVPIHSLYGKEVSSLVPTAEQLDGIDVLIFDVQDVGSRYYTFAATMLYAMQAAADLGLSFLVLDRPNPIGGVVVEGPTVQPGFESFVGAYPLPIRHGMTVGELARMFQAERGLDLDLDVIPCRGWSRAMSWDDTGIPWVAPSPNMPMPSTAQVYPGACLLEGTNLSEGRGTTRPFELSGAPWIDPYAITTPLNEVPGALLRPCAFRPMFHKHAGLVCQGAQPHVISRGRFRSVGLYAACIALARGQGPEAFAWRTEPYEFVTDPIAIDLLFGSARERALIEAFDPTGGESLQELHRAFCELWHEDEQSFLERRAPYLIYG